VSSDILELARELSLQDEPFALATVVWRRAPASGKEGYKGLITADGRVHGWIGGACAEPAVVREAVRALQDGQPRLLLLGPAEEVQTRAREGTVMVPIACQSEGALEVYVEPVLPRPQLVVVGRSPAVDVLTSMAHALGWRTAVIDKGGVAGAHLDADLVVTDLDFEAAGVTARSLIVIATQGHYDESALSEALRIDAAYVGLIASRKRASSVLGYLRDQGFGEETLSRVHSPAGLDLGKVAHEEIAVAVLGELVRLRAAGDLGGPVPAVGSIEVIDPVCAMTVEVGSEYRASHEGRIYYFCCRMCREEFEGDPERFAAAPK
jgi:xanthine dehydrogenase accessory factor